jgi:hypothetical protein
MRLAALVFALAACGSSQPAPPPTPPGGGVLAVAPDANLPPPASAPRADGTEGAICSWGENSGHRGEKTTACGEGLTCCYGCGIPGCNSTCMKVTSCPKYP